MNKLLTLNINKLDSLNFVTVEKNNNIINLYNVPFKIFLKKQNQTFKIHNFAVGDDLYDFVEKINDCLNNKRKIPVKLGKDVDLGLLWNNHRQKIIVADESGEALSDWAWAGDFLILFFNHADRAHSCVTFLYNDNQGNIVFEVSLEYPWFFGEDVPDISYNDWLSTYKILYKTVISKEIAQQWVKELNVLYEKLDANMSN